MGLFVVRNPALGADLARTTERCRHGAFGTWFAFSRTGFVFECCWRTTLAVKAARSGGSLLTWSGWENTCRLLLVGVTVTLALKAFDAAVDGDRAFRTGSTLCRSTLRAEGASWTALTISTTFSEKSRKADTWWNNASRGLFVWNEGFLTFATGLQSSTGCNEA